MIGITKIGTDLDFDVMSNPFNIQKMTESEAIFLVKNEGFKFKRVKEFGKVVVILPIGDTYDFIENLRENKIYIENNGIGIK